MAVMVRREGENGMQRILRSNTARTDCESLRNETVR